MDRDQIIKALECCTNETCAKCSECPYDESCGKHDNRMLLDTLALIRDILAENESVRAEIVREMAERVKKKVNEINMNLCGLYPFIDQIANEMLEEDK